MTTTPSPSTAGDLPAARPGSTRALVLATLAFTACFYAWSLLGPLSPTLQKQLHLSDLQTSAMVAVPVLLGSLLRIPMGLLTDRLGGRRVFTALLVASVGPVLALAFVHSSLGALLALGFFLGMSGASFAVGVPFVNGWFAAERQGYALGVYGMGMGGTVIAALTAPHISDAAGLAAPFLVAAGLLVITAVVFAAGARDAASPATAQRVRFLASLAPFRSLKAWALTLFYFLSFGGFVAMFLYLPKLLTGVHHLTKTDAGARAAGFALLAVLARPAGGWLADRIGASRVLRVSFTATIVLAALLSFGYKTMLPLTVECLLLAVAFGLGTGAVFKLVAAWFPASVGGVTGVVGAAGGLGGFFPPLVMGAVKSAFGSYVIGFLLLAAVGAFAVGVLAALDRAGTSASAPRRQGRTVGRAFSAGR